MPILQILPSWGKYVVLCTFLQITFFDICLKFIFSKSRQKVKRVYSPVALFFNTILTGVYTCPYLSHRDDQIQGGSNK